MRLNEGTRDLISIVALIVITLGCVIVSIVTDNSDLNNFHKACQAQNGHVVETERDYECWSNTGGGLLSVWH